MADFGDTRLPRRFWEKVEIDPKSGCWAWTACKNDEGYGWFWLAGRMRRAHRLAYRVLVGEMPSGLVGDHLCRVRRCVNPEHLEPVTQRENTIRGDTAPARNVAKTHCEHGHEFTEDNISAWAKARGRRQCRVCERRRAREQAERRRARGAS
jgi:hypothetical protein